MSATFAFAGSPLWRIPAVQSAAKNRRRRPMTVALAAAARAAPSPYEVLRVKRTASAMEIKAAYRALAKRFHPDVASAAGDGPDFLEIQRAYTTLSDPAVRARFDRSVGPIIGNGLVDGRIRSRRWETDQCW